MVRNRAFQSYKGRSEPKFDSNVQQFDYIQPGGWKTLFSSCLLLRNWDFLLGSSLCRKKETRPEKNELQWLWNMCKTTQILFSYAGCSEWRTWMKILFFESCFHEKKKKEWIMMFKGSCKIAHIVFWCEKMQ